MEKINDYHNYTQLMRNGFYDKLFFIDKLFGDWTTLVDYGCAEGFQAKLLGSIFPDKSIFGYDPDEQMITLAKYGGENKHNVQFSSSQNVLEDKDIVFLCSVLHEIYSYRKITPSWDKNFANMIFSENRKYVIIRDMKFTGNENHNLFEYNNCIKKVKEYLKRINAIGELDRFEEIFSSINVSSLLTHFMLKLPYINSPNWNREIHEDYFAFPYTTFKNLIPGNWSLDYEENYQLPYLKWWWRKELGIEHFPYNTHTKYIIRNNNI